MRSTRLRVLKRAYSEVGILEDGCSNAFDPIEGTETQQESTMPKNEWDVPMRSTRLRVLKP